MSDIEVLEKRSLGSIFIGFLFICMALASLLSIKGLSTIPDTVNFTFQDNDFSINIHGLIYLLATPSRYAGSIWGEESMAMSIAFLFFGLGLSFLFKKKIFSRIRK